MSNDKPKDSSIGAIWIKQGAKGEYLSISLELEGRQYNLTAFTNSFKESGDKKPDYRILPIRDPQTKIAKYERQIESVKQQAVKAATQEQARFVAEDDLPF